MAKLSSNNRKALAFIIVAVVLFIICIPSHAWWHLPLILFNVSMAYGYYDEPKNSEADNNSKSL